MAPRKKLNDQLSGMEAICAKMSEKFGVQAETLEQASKSISYLTFMDPHTGLPSIAHEYLIGAAGFRNGTVVQLRGLGGTGKSALCMLEYASANRAFPRAFCAHIETEGALMTAGRGGSFAIHPKNVAVSKGLNSFEKCAEFVDTFRCVIRGGDPKGTVNDLGRKSATKFKVEDAEDPECKYPILIGIDSLSALGKDDNVHTDISDMSKTQQISWLTVKIREWGRQRASIWQQQNVTLFLTTHETQAFDIGKKSYTGPKKSSVAGEAIKMFDTTGIDFTANDWKGPDGTVVGKIIGLKTFKNRMVREGRRIGMYLSDAHGFDMIHTDATFLMSEFGPFKTKGFGYVNSECKRDAWGIYCPAVLGEKKTKSEEEFVRAFYEKTDLLMDVRNQYRVCGYGLPHESMYENEFDENHFYIGPQPDASESESNDGFPEDDAAEPEE